MVSVGNALYAAHRAPFLCYMKSTVQHDTITVGVKVIIILVVIVGNILYAAHGAPFFCCVKSTVRHDTVTVRVKLIIIVVCRLPDALRIDLLLCAGR